MSRPVTHRYRDPLDEIWEGCARRLGLSIVRSDEAFASTDGRGRLVVGTAETLDDDDCLAQVVFHELCHSLVQGRDSFQRVDWGLENTDSRDLVEEHACLRVQALLAARHGLRRVLAPTTEHRSAWEEFASDPLGAREEPSVRRASRAVRSADEPPWAPHLDAALAATRAVLEAVRPFLDDTRGGRPSLASLLDPRPAPHPSGLPAHPLGEVEGTCGDCAWRTPEGRCVQADGASVAVAWRACERWEAQLDCRPCAACCREGYDLVPVEPGEALRSTRPDLLEPAGDLVTLRRVGSRCIALSGEPGATTACTIYEERPAACSELEVGGEHCLAARRRCGLSV